VTQPQSHDPGTGAANTLLKPGSALAPFRWPAFRSIWFANLASALGSMIQMIAAAWLMTELTTSHLLVALVQASVTIPVLMFGVIAGVIADNYDRRKVMLTANIGMFVLSLVLAFAAFADAIEPWSLLLLTLLIGSGFALNGPAWQASVRLLVDREDLPQAISLNAISFNAARSVGPAIGGLLLLIWGPAVAFAINAASYLVMITVLARWRPRPTGRDVKHAVFPALGEGIRYCLASNPLRRVLIRALAFGIGSVGFQALVPLVAKEKLASDEVGFGLIFGSFGVGSIVIAFWIAPFRRRFGPEAAVSGAMLISAIAVAGMALAPTVPLAMAAAFLAGCGHVSAFTSLNVSMQFRSPEALIGRCLAIFQAMAFGGMGIGAWMWGTTSDFFGLETALFASSFFLVASLVILRITAPMPAIGEGHVEADDIGGDGAT
jgi:MFS family permease